MLNKLKGLLTNLENKWRTNRILSLYNKGMYTQIPKKLNSYEKYQKIKIHGYPFVFFMIGIDFLMQNNKTHNV